MPKFTPKISVIDATRRLRSDTINELSGIYRSEEKIYYSEGQSSIYTIQKPANDLTIASLTPLILVNTSLHSVDFSFTNIAINGYYISLLLAFW